MWTGLDVAATVAQNRHMTTMTRLADILDTVRDSVDYGDVDSYDPDDEDNARTLFWLAVMRGKSSDSGFSKLVHSVLENGWDESSCIGWDEKEKCITEGHHRLVLAILLCLEWVPTATFGKDGDYDLCAHDCTWGCDDYNENSGSITVEL
jgi:hypothetical protein